MSAPTRDPQRECARHLSFGWRAFLVFAVLGVVLETLHGFKVRAYLDVSNETRRLMWTLAHAHGALLSLVNVIFALALKQYPRLGGDHLRLTSACLIAATVLVPAGFFAGGVGVFGGDPGIGIALLPIGALALLVALIEIARSAGRA